MRTRSKPLDYVEELLNDGEPLPLGDYALRDDAGGLKTRYPRRAQDFNDVEQGDKVKKFADQETGATVTIPIDELEGE